MTDEFKLEASSIDATDSTDSTAKDVKKRQVPLRIPTDVDEAIQAFLANASPTLIAKIDAATMTDDGTPHKGDLTRFVAFAIRETLKIQDKPRAFGTKIEEYVESVMARNLESFEQRPENWWERVAISRSLLTSPEAGHNPNSVKRWMEENADRIAAHHAEIGIEDATDHNRKAGKARKAMQQ